MARRISRRNGPAVSIRTALALLAAATCIFLGGLASFAWAVDMAREHASAPSDAADAVQSAPTTSAGTGAQTGMLLYPGTATPDVPAEEEAAAQDDDVQPGGDSEAAADNAGRTAGNDEGSDGSRSGVSSSHAQMQHTKTIHHTAFKRVAVYKTVTHKAAVESTKVVDGQTVTVWTLCPVCGQRHSKSYTEKVLDHYENVYCEACGKKHSASYTETVRY